MNESRLQGKLVLMTGAGSSIGLGRAMTIALVGAGARVAMMDLDRASLEATAAEVRQIGGPTSVETIVGDVTKSGDAERAIQDAIERLGGLHILFNNAGINPAVTPAPPSPDFAQISTHDWTSTMQVNINGPFFMARAAVGYLIAQGWGRIIGVTTSLDTMIRAGPYGPSKAAHEALMAIIAREIDGTGVTANVLIPGGAVATNMTKGRWLENMLQPEIMQAPAVWLASEASNGINGRRIIAEHWDEELPIDERLAKAAAATAWPGLGRQGFQSSRG